MLAIMKHAMSDTRRQGGDQSAHPALHIITGLGFGGAERLLYNIASESVAAGHSILVVSLLPGGDFRPLFEAARIEVVDLGMRRRRPSLSGLLGAAARARIVVSHSARKIHETLQCACAGQGSAP